MPVALFILHTGIVGKLLANRWQARSTANRRQIIGKSTANRWEGIEFLQVLLLQVASLRLSRDRNLDGTREAKSACLCFSLWQGIRGTRRGGLKSTTGGNRWEQIEGEGNLSPGVSEVLRLCCLKVPP